MASIPGVLASLGVIWRKQWGRILAFIVAGLAMLVGLLSLTAYKQDAADNALLIAFGAAHLCHPD